MTMNALARWRWVVALDGGERLKPATRTSVGGGWRTMVRVGGARAWPWMRGESTMERGRRRCG
ncbi:uncharacterized protein G2W53_041769 [Senna tora]|uniref:Uncharacterized protein n=1 Tax=Senna tora TaxID=362788 RepID=A0A834SFB0_9FABA|nr:uncharacterized protein G2W53_041769 [Senna tora]